MASLRITGFSCIDDATINVAKMTVIIGPQASGKSVISKLLYFMYDIVGDVFDTYEADANFEEFVNAARERFIKSFPPSAWGLNSFKIIFTAGPIEIVVSRAKPRKSNQGKLRLDLSAFVEEEFDRVRAEVAIARSKASEGEKSLFYRDWEISWQVQNAALRRLESVLGPDFAALQLFIPAGRSFFTNMGRAVLAFEQGGILDRLTIDFGKKFLSYREDADQRIVYSTEHTVPKDITQIRERLTEQLFSGEIVMERNDPHVQTRDGRRVPFSVLSSGQQELLPLWLTLNGFVDQGSAAKLIYIEEPEAHLFPLAQGWLAKYLARIVSTDAKTRMVITTYSPYILTVLNNLLKAGQLGLSRARKEQAEIEAIIPRTEWLNSSEMSAYAIVDRKVHSILHDDGLIDAEYLDEVSGKIGSEFMELLAIEARA